MKTDSTRSGSPSGVAAKQKRGSVSETFAVFLSPVHPLADQDMCGHADRR